LTVCAQKKTAYFATAGTFLVGSYLFLQIIYYPDIQTCNFRYFLIRYTEFFW